MAEVESALSFRRATGPPPSPYPSPLQGERLGLEWRDRESGSSARSLANLNGDVPSRNRGIWRIPLAGRRALLFFGTILITVLAGGVFARSFFVGPADWVVALGGAFLLILCLFGHFSWLLWMIGFVGWRTRPVGRDPPDEPITTRTALVMPIYHEDVDRVAAGIRQTWLSVTRAGLAAHCDFYVLSDSVQPAIQRAEEQAVRELRPLFSNNTEGTYSAPGEACTGFQPAVSPISNRPAARRLKTLREGGGSAGWKPATQQVGNLYSFSGVVHRLGK
ncbi:MAG: hypothetical protein AAB676_10175, partial [Verrucomicrobiota bacterium]